MNLQEHKENIVQDGVTVIRNFFRPQEIVSLRKAAQSVFEHQFEFRKYEGSFTRKVIRLFNEERSVFINCGKIIQQGLMPLHRMAFGSELEDLVKALEVEKPLVCTRPVLFFNHPDLAEEEFYYKTPAHQDWPSMQASMNSLVIWVPLVDVTSENGAVIFYPGTHKHGVLPYKRIGGFAGVDKPGTASIQPELKIGDIAVFSTFLVHESGRVRDNSIRWSCHFRYTDLSHNEFIERGYPNPYIYKPTYDKSE